jgi:hypothetical protein
MEFQGINVCKELLLPSTDTAALRFFLQHLGCIHTSSSGRTGMDRCVGTAEVPVPARCVLMPSHPRIPASPTRLPHTSSTALSMVGRAGTWTTRWSTCVRGRSMRRSWLGRCGRRWSAPRWTLRNAGGRWRSCRYACVRSCERRKLANERISCRIEHGTSTMRGTPRDISDGMLKDDAARVCR